MRILTSPPPDDAADAASDADVEPPVAENVHTVIEANMRAQKSKTDCCLSKHAFKINISCLVEGTTNPRAASSTDGFSTAAHDYPVRVQRLFDDFTDGGKSCAPYHPEDETNWLDVLLTDNSAIDSQEKTLSDMAAASFASHNGQIEHAVTLEKESGFVFEILSGLGRYGAAKKIFERFPDYPPYLYCRIFSRNILLKENEAVFGMIAKQANKPNAITPFSNIELLVQLFPTGDLPTPDMVIAQKEALGAGTPQAKASIAMVQGWADRSLRSEVYDLLKSSNLAQRAFNASYSSFTRWAANGDTPLSISFLQAYKPVLLALEAGILDLSKTTNEHFVSCIFTFVSALQLPIDLRVNGKAHFAGDGAAWATLLEKTSKDLGKNSSRAATYGLLAGSLAQEHVYKAIKELDLTWFLFETTQKPPELVARIPSPDRARIFLTRRHVAPVMSVFIKPGVTAINSKSGWTKQTVGGSNRAERNIANMLNNNVGAHWLGNSNGPDMLHAAFPLPPNVYNVLLDVVSTGATRKGWEAGSSFPEGAKEMHSGVKKIPHIWSTLSAPSNYFKNVLALIQPTARAPWIDAVFENQTTAATAPAVVRRSGRGKGKKIISPSKAPVLSAETVESSEDDLEAIRPTATGKPPIRPTATGKPKSAGATTNTAGAGATTDTAGAGARAASETAGALATSETAGAGAMSDAAGTAGAIVVDDALSSGAEEDNEDDEVRGPWLCSIIVCGNLLAGSLAQEHVYKAIKELDLTWFLFETTQKPPELVARIPSPD
ncbi:hypothetical protein Rhopal_003481-T1, partial [Rhodotorula paludigena]